MAAAVIGLALATLPARAPAEHDRAQDQARLPVKIIAGRLVVRCELSTKFRRIPANLLVDFDRRCGFELHNRAAAGIRVDAGGGVPITIHVPGTDITVERRELGDEEYWEELTKLYSKELGENALVGALGSGVLSRYHVTFDLAQGYVFLEPPHEKSAAPPDERDGEVLASVTLTNEQVWVPVRVTGGAAPKGRVMAMNLATTTFDSLVDQDLCAEFDAPAGDIGAVRMQAHELTKYVALRPVELVQVHTDGALGTIGLNLLRHFRVEVDRVNRLVRFRETRPAAFPTADRTFFAAMVDEDTDALREVMQANADHRLAREAAEQLLNLLVDEDAEADALTEALTWMDRTRIADLRSTEALRTVKMMLEAQRRDLAIEAGQLGVKSGRADRYPESVHKLHAKLGELLLDENRDDEAWEHLLSAAFGLPEDGMINLHLGRFYERKKRHRRAMSRYLQAVIQPESGPLAIPGLERVQLSLGGEPFSVDLVDRLIAGKVYNFGAATTFEASDATDTNRVAVAELFTNPHFGRRLTEGWRSFNVGGVLGQEGLLSHFPRSRLAVLTYHVDQPEPSALINELSMHMAASYGSNEPTYMKINGSATGPGAGRFRDAEVIYRRNQAAVVSVLRAASKFDIKVDAQVDGDRVHGAVTARGPARDDMVLQIVLAERGVLYPGKGKVVVHRMVARAALTDSLDGVAFAPADGVMRQEFACSLAAVRKRNERFLADYEKANNTTCTRLSTHIDPTQVTVVAMLRNRKSLEILQAAQVDAVRQEKPR